MPPWLKIVGISVAILIFLGLSYRTFVQRTDQVNISRGGQQTSPSIRPGFGGCAITKIYTAKDAIAPHKEMKK